MEHSGVHVRPEGGYQPISGVPTSITAFVGWTPSGHTDKPGHVRSMADYEAAYGSSGAGPLGDAIRLYFANGGRAGC